MKMFERHRIRGIRRVSKKELSELSKLPWLLDEALSSSTEEEARVLPDGRILLVSHVGGTTADLFPSRKEVEQWSQHLKESRAEWEKTGGRFDPAKELLPPLDDFLRDVDKLASGLAKVLHIPEAALDRSVESIDLVDKALLRVTIAKRMTPEIFAPVTAYLGEVMRLVCDGRWGKMPATIKRRLPEYDPAELKPFMAAQDVASRAAWAAAEKAYADAKAGRASEYRACLARDEAHRETLRAHSMPELKPIGYKEYDEPVRGHEHEPVLWAHDGALVQPVASVVRSLSERSTYGTLRTAVEGHLARYLSAKRKAAAAGGAPST